MAGVEREPERDDRRARGSAALHACGAEEEARRDLAYLVVDGADRRRVVGEIVVEDDGRVAVDHGFADGGLKPEQAVPAPEPHSVDALAVPGVLGREALARPWKAAAAGERGDRAGDGAAIESPHGEHAAAQVAVERAQVIGHAAA